MPFFTFSTENSYGIDSTTQDYVLDLVSENVIENVNYVKPIEWNKPTRTQRYPTVETTKGRVEFELTYGNEAWNILFKILMGQKVRLAGLAFGSSSENWKVLTGVLTSDLDSSATSFNITEYKTGEFDNVDGVIINNEYIAVSSISNGAVSNSTRASEGTTAALHGKNALVYGVVISGGKYIDIISRYRDGFSYFLPTSLTCLIYREGDYFCFPGTLFSDLVFNAQPSEGISVSSMMISKYSKVITLANPSTAEDDGVMADIDHIGIYSMGGYLDIENLYFQISNTLTPAPPNGIFDTTPSSMILNQFSAFGQFSAVESSKDFITDYEDNADKNISMAICNNRNLDNVFVFAFNDLKWGTMIHTLRASILIEDSIPFYCYGADSFTVMIQN